MYTIYSIIYIRVNKMNYFTEDSIWIYLKNTDKPIIIYGMGNGADKVLNLFKHYGIKCSGVMASDSFVRGQSYNGFTVQKLSYFKETLNDFIIAIAFGTQVPDVINHIRALENSYEIVVPNVPVFGSNIFDDDFLHANAEKIETAYSLLSDNRSKAVFENAVKFYYTGRLKYLWDCTDTKDEIFDNVLKLSPTENYMDLGAYRGDTLQELIEKAGGFNRAVALEPDPKTYKKLCLYINDKPNVTAYQKTIWKNDTTLYFDNKGGRNSTIGNNGTPLEATCIDTLCNEITPTYIKMDVEGAEKQALAGGIKTISKYKPKMNIAAYHTFEDLFELMLIVNAINPEYRFYLRHHPYIPLWDTNLYCV